MGFSKGIAIEHKLFEVVRNRRHVTLFEKGWKVATKMRLGLVIARWFSKALEDNLKIGRKEYYFGHREGDRGYIAQRCSNFGGIFMALVEYGGGGRRSCIFIPEDTDGMGWDGMGWRKLVEELKEAGREGGFLRLPPSTKTVHTSTPRSYMEVLQSQKRKP